MLPTCVILGSSNIEKSNDKFDQEARLHEIFQVLKYSKAVSTMFTEILLFAYFNSLKITATLKVWKLHYMSQR